MITLRYSTTNGLLCQVFEDSQLIGRVRMEKRMTCDKFIAVIHGEVEKGCGAQEFDNLFDALDWVREAQS